MSGRPVPQHCLVAMHDDGDTVDLSAEREPVVVLYGHAEPLGEPVVSHGPFVMNTREEIVQAVRDYQAGLFDAPAQQPG